MLQTSVGTPHAGISPEETKKLNAKEIALFFVVNVSKSITVLLYFHKFQHNVTWCYCIYSIQKNYRLKSVLSVLNKAKEINKHLFNNKKPTLVSWISIRTSGFLPLPPPTRPKLFTCLTGVWDGELWGVELQHKDKTIWDNALVWESLRETNNYGSPSTSSRWSDARCTPKVFSSVKMPDDRYLLDEVADLWDGEINGSPTGLIPIHRLTEVIFFNFYWIWG